MNENTMSSLPSGWARVRVKDVADSIQYGHTASAIERKEGPRFLRITDIQDGRVEWNSVPSCDIPDKEIPKYRLAVGDLVFARTGATTGKSYLIRECPEAVFASYLIRIRVSGALNSRYLSAFFQSPDYWRQIEGGKRGIGQPNVNGKILGEVQFPLAPLAEQGRIVGEVEKQATRLEAGIAALRRVQANLKRYRAAVLKAACEGELVITEAELAKKEHRKYETGSELLQRILAERRTKAGAKHKEPAKPDTKKLPKLPEGWVWASFEQMVFFAQNGVSKRRAESGKLTGVLRLADVISRKVSLDQLREINLSKEEINKYVLKKNDLLCIRVNGSKNLVGRLIRFGNGDNIAFCDHFIRFIPSYFGMISNYLEIYSNTEYVRRYIEHNMVSSAGQNTVSQPTMFAIAVALPPLTEIARIISEVDQRLSIVDELNFLVEADLLRAARLRQAILKRAFEGEL